MRTFSLLLGSLLCSSLLSLTSPHPSSTANTGDPRDRDLIHRSVDLGNTWQDVSIGLPDKSAVSGAAISNNTLYVSTPDGIYHMGTQDARWHRALFLDAELSHFYLGRTGLYAFGYKSGIYQNLFGTGMWMPKFGNLPDKGVCEFLETADGTLFVGDDQGIVRSGDGGANWQRVHRGATVGNIWAGAHGVMLASGAFDGLLRSTNGGTTWTPILKKYQEPMRVRVCGNRLVAFMSDKTNATTRLFSSTDAGATWQPLIKNLPSRHSMIDVAQVGDALLCSFENGVFRTTDGGATWTCVRVAERGVWYELLPVGRTLFLTRGFGC